MEVNRKPWWRYIYQQGFDAPLIAMLWLFIFAKTWRVNYHPWQAYVALGLMVWALRITVKLLSSALVINPKDQLQEARKYLTRLTAGAGAVSLLLIVIYLPTEIYLSLLILCVLVIAYFAITNFSTEPEGQISYPKHVLAGLSFSFGISIMAHVYLPSVPLKELFSSREFICFGLLCIITSAAVEHWMRAKENDQSRYPDEWQIALPLTLLGAFALVFAVQAESQTTRPFFYSILTSAALLQILNRTIYRFQTKDIKILTSACFLVPGLIFQAYRMSL